MSSTTETGSSMRPFRVGEWLVEPSLNRLSREGVSARLDLKTIELLQCLADHAGDVVSNQQLVDSVWQVEAVSLGRLTSAVAELRKALGDDARDPTYIETVPKRGYRLIAPVTQVEGVDDGAPRRWNVRVVALVAVPLLALATIVVWRALTGPPRGILPTEPKRIVVLPFINLGAPEDEYFADGMTVELINRLAAVSGLHVISNTTAMKYKDSRRSIPEIGDELGVQYALEGEVRWEPTGGGVGRVRISPQLILIAEDRNIWTHQYDRDIQSIFSVQSDIAQQVTEQLEVELLEPEIQAVDARPTENMDAYNAYLRGLHRWGAPSRENLKLAMAMFKRAAELDPEFALAHAYLSIFHSSMYGGRADLDPERMAQAKRAADRALELDPDLPEGHWALGMFYSIGGERDRALAEYRVALALRPNDAEALAITAGFQKSRGEWQEAIGLLERTVELDPHNVRHLGDLAWTYMLLRRYPEADAIVERAIAIAPDNAGLYVTKIMIFAGWHGFSHSWDWFDDVVEVFPDLERVVCIADMERRNYEAALACFDSISEEVHAPVTSYTPVASFESECYARMGEPELAREKLEEAREILERAAGARPDDPVIVSALGPVYARLGRTEEAIRAAERAVAMSPVSENAPLFPNYLFKLALTYMHAGEHDAALDTIDTILSMPAEMSVRWFNGGTWDPLRDHPRFAEIMEKHGGV